MSKFDKIFEARGEKGNETSVEKKEKSPNGTKTKNKSDTTGGLDKNGTIQYVEGVKPPKQRGRPQAKRSDPQYVGFTTYIRKDTHLKVKIALLQEAEGRELSELVEELLSKWVKNK